MYTCKEMRTKRASNALNLALNIKYFDKNKGSFWMSKHTYNENERVQLQFHIKRF